MILRRANNAPRVGNTFATSVEQTKTATSSDLEWFFAANAAGGDIHAQIGAARGPSFFDVLTTEARDRFIAACTRRRFVKGQNLFMAGQVHTANYVIESGLVQTYYQTGTGKEMTAGYRSRGEIVGGPYFFDDSGVHIWCARAAQECDVLSISGNDLRRIAVTERVVGDAVFHAIASKLVWDSLLLQILATRSIRDRLTHLLVRLAVFHGEREKDTVIIRHFSHDDLANMIGASRQWVSTQLGELRKRGTVAVTNRTIVILRLSDLMQKA